MNLRRKYLYILLIAVLVAGGILSSFLFQNAGFRIGYDTAREEYKIPNYQYWMFLHDNGSNSTIKPTIGFGLNFSEVVEDIQIVRILVIAEEEIYGINITASKGKRTEYGFMIMFNEAVSFHYYKKTIHYYENHKNITPYIGRTVYKEHYYNGIHYPQSYINLRGFEVAKAIQVEIVMSNVIL